MESKVSLLEKYSIPLSHLDFGYIKECKDVREMERIVQILRSGEEGFFPDLTTCAEDKLRELNPNSKQFRVEEPMSKYFGGINNTAILKFNDRQLSNLHNALAGNDPLEFELPPVRTMGKIIGLQQEREKKASSNRSSPREERIKSTDYRRWDEYDPDVEVLRMELSEERVKEQEERKNRINTWKTKLAPPAEKIIPDADGKGSPHVHLTDLEREKLSEDIRMRGNDYFRSKEYEKAIWEYDQSILLHPNVAVFSLNNRAICNIRLKRYGAAIKDCEECIKTDPSNLKAWLRYALACNGQGRIHDAYQLYEKVLEMDPPNNVAQKALGQLRLSMCNMAPPNATRIEIQQHEGPTTSMPAGSWPNNKELTEAKRRAASQHPATLFGLPEHFPVFCYPTDSQSPPATLIESSALYPDFLTPEDLPAPPAPSAVPAQPSLAKEYDLCDLVVPNKIVKSKLEKAAETLGSFSLANDKQKPAEPKNTSVPPAVAPPMLDLLMPANIDESKSKPAKSLIEEL